MSTNVSLHKRLQYEWKMIRKPEHIVYDTLFVVASCVAGACLTAGVDLAVEKVMMFFIH